MSRHASVETTEPTLSRNERRRKRTRQQLLDSTAALLVELGYDALTVQEITDDADVARATFYIHFQDKEAAVWAILEEHFTHLLGLLSALDEPDPARWRYKKYLGLFKYAQENKPLMQVLLSDRGHVRLRQQIVRFMASSLTEDLERGKVEPTIDAPAKFEATFYAGALLNVIAWWLNDTENMSPHELADLVYEIILRKPPPKLTE